MSAAGPLRGPGTRKEAASPPLTFRAAALGPGDAPREDTGPPLSVKAGCARRATADRQAAWHRYTPSPALTLSLRRPQGQEKRAGPSLPRPGAARPVTAVPRATSGRRGRSELAFDSQKRKEKLHKFRPGLPGPVTSSQQSHLAKLRHTEPGVHETRDAPFEPATYT